MTALPDRTYTTDRDTARQSRKGDEPVLTPKWTIVNDEWVQAQFLLARSKSGLSDRPATTEPRSAS